MVAALISPKSPTLLPNAKSLGAVTGTIAGRNNKLDFIGTEGHTNAGKVFCEPLLTMENAQPRALKNRCLTISRQGNKISIHTRF